MKNDKKYFILTTLLVIILVVLSIVFLGNSSGEYDGFAKCLTANGAVMYGTDWCSHCQNEKSMFGSSFQYVNFVNCDYDSQACTNAGVEGYPTWNINGNIYPGEKTLEQISSLSGCSLN